MITNASLHTSACRTSFKTTYIFSAGSLTKTQPLAHGTERTALLLFQKDHGNGLQAKASMKSTILQTARDERDPKTMLFRSSHKLCNPNNLIDHKDKNLNQVLSRLH